LSGQQLDDILRACRHIGDLLPELAFDYESACPVRPAALQKENVTKTIGGKEE
jgi:hypothetical protein